MVKWSSSLKTSESTNFSGIMADEEMSPHMNAASVAFRALSNSMSVISSSIAVDYEMTSRSPSLGLISATDTIHSAIRNFNHDLLQVCLYSVEASSPQFIIVAHR